MKKHKVIEELQHEIKIRKWWQLAYYWFVFGKKRKMYLKYLRSEKRFLEDFDYFGEQVARQVYIKRAIMKELVKRFTALWQIKK